MGPDPLTVGLRLNAHAFFVHVHLCFDSNSVKTKEISNVDTFILIGYITRLMI